jgi:hypothetical protein
MTYKKQAEWLKIYVDDLKSEMKHAKPADKKAYQEEIAQWQGAIKVLSENKPKEKKTKEKKPISLWSFLE